MNVSVYVAPTYKDKIGFQACNFTISELVCRRQHFAKVCERKTVEKMWELILPFSGKTLTQTWLKVLSTLSLGEHFSSGIFRYKSNKPPHGRRVWRRVVFPTGPGYVQRRNKYYQVLFQSFFRGPVFLVTQLKTHCSKTKKIIQKTP